MHHAAAMLDCEPPAARVEPVVDIHFGHAVADPYRWMEQWHGEEFQDWLRAQGAYSRAYLDALPGRSPLRERVNELGDSLPKISGLFLARDRCFYLRRDPGAKQSRLVVRCGLYAP